MPLSIVQSYGPGTCKLTGSTITVPAVTAQAGDILVVHIGDNYTNASLTDLQWGSLALGDFLEGLGIDNTIAVEGLIYAAVVVSGGTNDVVAVYDGNITGAVAVDVIRGATGAAVDGAIGDFGTSAAPSSGATAGLTDTNELQLALFVTQGPVEDQTGTLGNSLAASVRGGTTGGVATSNITIATAAVALSSNAPVTASKSGITSRSWLAGTVTLRAQPAPLDSGPRGRNRMSLGASLIGVGL